MVVDLGFQCSLNCLKLVVKADPARKSSGRGQREIFESTGSAFKFQPPPHAHKLFIFESFYDLLVGLSDALRFIILNHCLVKAILQHTDLSSQWVLFQIGLSSIQLEVFQCVLGKQQHCNGVDTGDACAQAKRTGCPGDALEMVSKLTYPQGSKFFLLPPGPVNTAIILLTQTLYLACFRLQLAICVHRP